MQRKPRALFDNADRHEPSAFKRGKSMSQQLREERERIEKSAIKSKNLEDILGYKDKPRNTHRQYNPTRMYNINAYEFIKPYLNPRRLTWKEIAIVLNDAGYRTRRGNEWRANKLCELVTAMENAL